MTLGPILPLILGVDVGAGVAPADFTGTVTVTADVDGARDAWVDSQDYVVAVRGSPLPDRGDRNASLLSRVRWLNSDFGLDTAGTPGFALPRPFTPITRVGATLALHSKEIVIAPMGLPASVSVATPPYAPRRVLARAATVAVPGWEAVQGAPPNLTFGAASPARVEWAAASVLKSIGGAADINLGVAGFADFDGYTEARARVCA